jgi:hypothetical protein
MASAMSENSLGETQVAHLEMLRRDLMGNGGQNEEAEDTRGATVADSMGRDEPTELEPTDAPIMKPTPVLAQSQSASQPPRASTTSTKHAPPRFASSASAPQAEMEIMVQQAHPESTLNGVAKAASFAGGLPNTFPDGDTQPQDSQVYHQFIESMRRESDTTPLRRLRSTSPNTLKSNAYEDGDRTPHTLQQQESGYVDLAGFLDGRDVSPVNSTQGFDELLDEEERSPETQMHAPPARNSSNGVVPQTPGGLPGQQGDVPTSITTGHKYSQLFPKADLMGQSQAFRQTQEVSSPFPSGPPSDPAMTRPSPNHVASSPIRGFSSPVQTRGLPGRTTVSMSEPRGEYTSMRESQEKKAARLRAAQENADVEESESEDDTQDRRFRDRLMRRTLSEQAMRRTANVRVMRPSYLDSARKSSPRKRGDKGQAIDLVTPGTVGRVRWDMDLIEDGNDEDDETQVELPVGDEDRGEGEDEGSILEPNDDDEYDELQQTVLRSQSNFQEDEDEHEGSAAEEVDAEPEAEDDELDDVHPPGDDEDEEMDRNVQDGPMATQRSTIADSQPTGQEPPRPTSQPTHHSSMASFIPGSQYTGKTSEELAFLKSSRPSQARVPASPLTVNEGEDKLPSSPPLPAVIDSNADVPDNSADESLARQNPMPRSQREQPEATGDSVIATTQHEIPESDLPEHQISTRTPRSVRDPANEDEESQNKLLYSTARTHVSASASAISPAKPSQPPSLLHQNSSYSPLKAFRHANPASQHLSQQSQMSPRRAVGVRRFGDVLTRGGSMLRSFEEDEVDVEGIMDGVMTIEDRAHLRALASPQKGSQAKRRKNVEDDVETEDAGGRAELVQQSNAVPEMEGTTIPESEHGYAVPPAAVRGKDVLRDSPSKANKLPTPPSADENEKGRSPTPESVRRREREGSRHVSQLIFARGPPATKKQKVTTYSRSNKRGQTKVAQKSRRSRRILSDDDEDEDVDRTDATPPPADRVHDAQDLANAAEAEREVEEDQAERDEAAKEADDASKSNANPSAPDRIWALFKGTYNHFYPATWLGSSLDGQTYKVRFDDTTVTDIETQHVRRLELQVGDLLRVDNKGMRKLTYRVVGHGQVASTKAERAFGTDHHGRVSVKVVAKANRASTAADDAGEDEDAGESQDVPINQLYLTHSMWKAFKDRTFTPPNGIAGRGVVLGRSRLSTPSEGVVTPAAEDTPNRSLRGVVSALSKRQNLMHAHLREASSFATSSDAIPSTSTPLFANMAFAITYLDSASEKSAVMNAILRHGGTILEDGFATLFDIPDLSSTPPTSDSTTQPQTLRLKPQFANLKFVALIADRHSRRAKYMQALALGLPALSGRWILDSLDPVRNTSISSTSLPATTLPWEKYSLPAGESSYLSGAIRSRTLPPSPHADPATATFADMIRSRPRLLRDEGVLIVAPPPSSSTSSSGAASTTTSVAKKEKEKEVWERTKTFVFLTLAIGAGRVRRVGSLSEVSGIVEGGSTSTTTTVQKEKNSSDRNGDEEGGYAHDGWGWIYVSTDVEAAYDKIISSASSTTGSTTSGRSAGGKTAPRAGTAKKRKRPVVESNDEEERGREKKLIKDGCSGKVLAIDDGRVRVVGDEFVIQSLILGDLVD